MEGDRERWSEGEMKREREEVTDEPTNVIHCQPDVIPNSSCPPVYMPSCKHVVYHEFTPFS